MCSSHNRVDNVDDRQQHISAKHSLEVFRVQIRVHTENVIQTVFSNILCYDTNIRNSGILSTTNQIKYSEYLLKE